MVSLEDIMEFDHPIEVLPDGSVIDVHSGIYAPELHMTTQEDSQILDSDEEDYEQQAENQGWTLLQGWTSQYSYHGVIMHPSEFIGGALEEHILSEPGIYVVITVETDSEDDNAAGWAIARRHDETVVKADKNVTPDLWY